MTRNRIHLLAATALAFASAPALAQSVETEGIIMRLSDGHAVIRTDNGERTLAIGPATEIAQDPGGAKKPASALIAGLPVTIKGHQVGNEIEADAIRYEAKDYRIAVQIQAGLSETGRSLQEVRAAVANIGEYEVKAETSIFFNAGSSVISDKGKQDLLQLADEAKRHQGYFISVLGYADPVGDPAANEKLSNERAQNVINFLKQNGGIQPGRVLAASAMGAVTFVGGAPEPTADAGARRVTARVVVSKAQLQQH